MDILSILFLMLLAWMASAEDDEERFNTDRCVIANQSPKVSMRISMLLACEHHEPLKKLESATRGKEYYTFSLHKHPLLSGILPLNKQWRAMGATDENGESVVFLTYANVIMELPPVKGTFVEYLYKNLVVEGHPQRNVAVCPLSLELVLAAVATGAVGYTRQEILRVLKVERDLIPLKYKNELDQLGLQNYKSVNMVTKLYLDQTYFPIKEKFRNVLNDIFKTHVQSVDFKDNYPTEIQIINQLVSDQTEGHIKDAVSEEEVNTNTGLLLVNTLYFKGEWENQFRKRQGFNDNFYLPNHVTVKATYMSRDGKYSYYKEVKDGNYKMLELPFLQTTTGPYSMIIILPDELDGLAKVEELLTRDNSWLTEFDLTSTDHVAVVKPIIPRFTVDTKVNLKSSLDQMGVREMFENSAQFSGMTSVKNLKVSKMYQRIYIDIDEIGTKAAAAPTIVPPEIKESKPNVINFKADHPFAFALIQREVKTVLFMGRVVKPGYDDLFTNGQYSIEEKPPKPETGMELLHKITESNKKAH